MAHFGYAHTPSFDGTQHGQGNQFVNFQTSQGSLKVSRLHGHLDIWVKEARNLPNLDLFHKTLNDFFGGLSLKGPKNTTDPYVTVSVAGAIIARTFVMRNDENPVWMQHFFVPVAHTAAELHFVVKDDDVVGSQVVGAVGIPVVQLCSGARIEGTFPIVKANGTNWENGAVLSVSIQYTPVDKMNMYYLGVGPGPDYFGVPSTYFPLRKRNRVTLYQDAHVEDGMLPEVRLDNHMPYVHGKCWRDIFNAISHARRLVYLTGWSVTHLVRLVRDAQNASGITLGALLKAKAQEGVRVLLLVWDDPTSRRICHFTTPGVLATGDEVTYQFFKGSSVHVVLCPRSGGKGHSLISKQEAGAIYTHHQKTVIVDADAGHYKRKIIAFVGGLDLCEGRYDTPEHSLFRTLETVHKDDFHQANFAGPLTKGLPREPWHDLHSQIDGPAAYDVLANFEDRWLKASKPRGLQKMSRSYDDHLLKIDKVPEIIGLGDAMSHSVEDTESWDVQVFRSLDSNSVKGFPKDPKDGTQWNLFCGKNVLIDMSIHTAYVHAIRSAQHFIYIENQYFLGSSYNWDSYRDLGANNLIPVEIALKIASKIRAKERFAVYVIVPMWPEGDPKSLPTQRILFWQYKTMQMMYGIIYKALEETGMENRYEPQDFLNFFCLGNREVSDEHLTRDSSVVTDNTAQGLTKKNRRFMIYVHSKGMIVDDEYVILGSANINQRSMEGTRDTEIAVGAYQPHYTWARKNSPPNGQVYGYRMSLWAEHLGMVDDCFKEPESLGCVRRVRTVAEQNWSQFASEEVTEMKAHLLKYPLQVDRTGNVGPLPGSETFPDLGGKVMGTFSGIQENLTI